MCDLWLSLKIDTINTYLQQDAGNIEVRIEILNIIKEQTAPQNVSVLNVKERTPDITGERIVRKHNNSLDHLTKFIHGAKIVLQTSAISASPPFPHHLD